MSVGNVARWSIVVSPEGGGGSVSSEGRGSKGVSRERLEPVFVITIRPRMRLVRFFLGIPKGKKFETRNPSPKSKPKHLHYI